MAWIGEIVVKPRIMVITQNANERNWIISTNDFEKYHKHKLVRLRKLYKRIWKSELPIHKEYNYKNENEKDGHEVRIDINNGHHLETMRNINTEETSYPS